MRRMRIGVGNFAPLSEATRLATLAGACLGEQGIEKRIF